MKSAVGRKTINAAPAFIDVVLVLMLHDQRRAFLVVYGFALTVCSQ